MAVIVYGHTSRCPTDLKSPNLALCNLTNNIHSELSAKELGTKLVPGFLPINFVHI